MLGLRNAIGNIKALISISVLLLGTSHAWALDPAKSDVLLTITGAISETNTGDAFEIDIKMLEEIGTVKFETTTVWTEGIQTFIGVELSDLLQSIGANGSQLRATAVNDYTVDIPISDAVEGGPIVAFMRNGKEMSLRDKGPLWIVYPFDSSPEYQSELVYSRSIWQLDRIEVLP